jgi:hypothetical protein
MPLIKDSEKYDQLHAQLLREILVAIKDELEASDLDHDHVYELTGKIGLAVTSAIDGSASIKHAGAPIHPFVAFSESESQRDTLIVNEQGSYLHELVYSLFDGIFEEHDDAHDEDEDEEDDEEEDEDEEEYDEDEEYEEDEDDAEEYEEEYEEEFEESEEDEEDEDLEDDSEPRRRH